MDTGTARKRLAGDARRGVRRWEHEGSRPQLGAMIARKLALIWLRYVVYRGNITRYLRRVGVRIGSSCSILNGVRDYGSEPWLIELGDRVTITRGVVFITHDGSSRVFRHLLPDSSPFGNRFGTIRVLDNSFVGAESILLPSVTIGPNSIVGAGSVVDRDVPANTVAAGVPARPICSLDEYVEKYKARMIPIASVDRRALRRELTVKLWGEAR
jgi:acetyltransferase-like isoleucine patch superfamily enzyme